MKYKPFQMLPPVTFHILDKKLRKKAEKLSTEGCEFVPLPTVVLPPQSVKPVSKKRPKKRRRRGDQQ
jgi:hypothetical protein